MKTVVKSPAGADYSPSAASSARHRRANLPNTQMSHTKEQQAGPAKGAASLTGQKAAPAALAGAALLVVGLSALQLLSLIAAIGLLLGLAFATFWHFAIKPILAMDFDISPANEEMAQIVAELWD